METYIVDWLNTMIRFAHFITGIAWIGASFYFNWLENNLNRSEGQKDGISGHLWAVHGGGFYYLEKYKTYPDKLPEHLHWFKWEAYFTLITGFGLLCVVYYYNATSFLLKAGTSLSATSGILMSLAGLVIAWLIYDQICKSSLVKKQNIVAFIMLILVFISALFYQQFFTPRAVFYQIGAMIGTIMVFNVFFVIMPSQRELVKACVDKTKVGEEVGFRGYIRSRNNNYFTLPVLFIMLSAHFPMFYTGVNPAIMLVLVFITTVLIRHYFNLRGEGKGGKTITLVVAGVITLAVFITLIPSKPKIDVNSQIVTFEQIKPIIENRCATCHSKNPTDDTFTIAPSGFILDTKEQIINAKDVIYSRTVATDSMPLSNKTNMTKEERDMLGNYIISLR
ncbi:urate hydroxylase PuuD [Arcobacter defluvii]|uniref:Cytochrome c urate oxidase n=1 Tax=Arcobacter defluvii TaxID=873191 RepID=A0AAE7E5P0_9BACT|nr:urate hydroxylase PuuD [Arcobacter defluvii]QKF77015.1 cytochrome c urate oxidase [Arcobacter defluvii]RXI29811.1 hypothetical protein CP964_13025 [Arcobacter defluvii]